MENLLKLFSLLFNEIRLGILISLSHQESIHASDILEKLDLSPSKLPNLLYHLNMLQREGLIQRDRSKRYFLTEMGRALVEQIKKLDELYTTDREVKLLLFEYPYVKSLSGRLMARIIMENYNLDANNSVMVADELIQKIRKYNINVLNYNLLNSLILNILLEKNLYKNFYNDNVERNYYKNNLKHNILNLLVNEIPESINHLDFFYIAGLDSFFNKFVDGRLNLRQVFRSLGFKQNDEKLFFKQIKQFVETLIRSSDMFSLGVLFSRLDILNAFFEEIKKKEIFMQTALSFINPDKKIVFSILLSNSESLSDILNPFLFENLSGEVLRRLNLCIEFNKTINNEQITKILDFIKEIPLITICGIEEKGNSSSLGSFNKNVHYDDNWAVNQLISLNLPRIVVKKRLDESRVLDELLELTKICGKIFLFKENRMNLNIKGNLAMSEEKNIFLINLVGLFEAILLITNNTLRDGSSYKLAKDILENMSKALEDIKSVSVLLSSVNDYNSNLLFCESDLLEKQSFNYNKSLRLILKNYGYTTGIIPAWAKITDLKERLALEVPLLSYLKGGYSLEFSLQSENLNEDYLKRLFEYISKYKLRNITLKSSLYMCESCKKKYLQEQEFCPNCMSGRIVILTGELGGELSLLSLEDFSRIRTLQVLI